jgi:hypothetical protein
MRRTLAVSLFVLATMTWVLAQNPGGAAQNSQQPPSATQTPDASQSQPSTPGTAGQGATQDTPQPAAPSASGPVTEGCLGGSSPNFTLTDKTGTTYKLNLPPNANAAVLTPHLGESIRVMGDVKDAGKAGQASIDVTKAGKGSSTCPAGSSNQQQPPKQ